MNTSRVAAFRAHEKRRRKRQRQIKAAAILVTCVLAGAYYYCCSASGGRQQAHAALKTNGGGDSLVSETASSAETTMYAVLEEEPGILLGGDINVAVNIDTLDGLANYSVEGVGACTNNNEDSDVECAVRYGLENQSPLEDGEDNSVELLVEQAVEGNGQNLLEWEGKLTDIQDLTDGVLAGGVIAKEIDFAFDDSSVGVTPLAQPDECSRRFDTHHSDPTELERRCKNPIQRIFNRQCRILARGRNRTQQRHVLNLLSGLYQ